MLEIENGGKSLIVYKSKIMSELMSVHPTHGYWFEITSNTGHHYAHTA